MSLIKNKEDDNFYPVAIPEVGWQCDYLYSTHRGCPFNCTYCSSKRLNKRFKSMDDPTELKRLKSEWNGDALKRCPLPAAGIFLSPYNDIMTIPDYDIREIFRIVNQSKEHWHRSDSFGIIMQTKDPAKYFDYLDLIPKGSWLGTTIETDLYLEYAHLQISKASHPWRRYNEMWKLKHKFRNQFKYFIAIEPIMKYGTALLEMMDQLSPNLIFVGCDTGKNNLPEPTRSELLTLIEELQKITYVHIKSNAKRILGDLTLHD